MKFTIMQVIAIISPPPIPPVIVAMTQPCSAAHAPPKRPARPAPAASIATPVAIPGCLTHGCRSTTDWYEVRTESNQDTADNDTDECHETNAR